MQVRGVIYPTLQGSPSFIFIFCYFPISAVADKFVASLGRHATMATLKGVWADAGLERLYSDGQCEPTQAAQFEPHRDDASNRP